MKRLLCVVALSPLLLACQRDANVDTPQRGDTPGVMSAPSQLPGTGGSSSGDGAYGTSSDHQGLPPGHPPVPGNAGATPESQQPSSR